MHKIGLQIARCMCPFLGEISLLSFLGFSLWPTKCPPLNSLQVEPRTRSPSPDGSRHSRPRTKFAGATVTLPAPAARGRERCLVMEVLAQHETLSIFQSKINTLNNDYWQDGLLSFPSLMHLKMLLLVDVTGFYGWVPGRAFSACPWPH